MEQHKERMGKEKSKRPDKVMGSSIRRTARRRKNKVYHTGEQHRTMVYPVFESVLTTDMRRDRTSNNIVYHTKQK